MIFKNFRIVQKAPIHHSHVSGRVKISHTVSEKSHPRNIPYFKIGPAASEKKIFYEFIHVHIVQEAPIH